MDPNPAFVITYPPSVTITFPLTTCEIEYNGVTYPMTCTNSGNTIKVVNGLSVSVALDDFLKVKLG